LPGHSVRPVFGLSAFVDELCTLVNTAQHRVYADFYVMGGAVGRTLAEALIQRHAEGLDVRLLLDGHLGTCWPLRPEALPVKAVLDRSGVPMRLAATRRGGRIVRRRVADHNKLIVADGTASCVGGTNVTDLVERFEDLAMRVDGPICADLERQFLHDWALAGHIPSQTTDGRDVHDTDLCFDDSGLLGHASIDGLASVRLVGTGPGRLTFKGALLNAIDSAERFIDVHVHQMDDANAVAALVRAHQRGVSVRVVLDPIELHHYIPGLRYAPRATVNAYAVATLGRMGVPVRFVRLDGRRLAYHMKLALFDRSVLLTGTANWTRRSMEVLTETAFEIAGGPAVADLQAWFDAGWRDRTDPAAVGLQSRALDAVFRLAL
jgi:phosphatidylserine/phosphatidylglycerophosphate/cardiolipin synthase-like enzyme